MKYRVSALLFGASSLATAPALHAQTIDYKSLEDLFGEPVTTSATGKPQRASDVPASMTIISQEQIRRTGATNIASILRRHGGIDANQWSAGANDIAVRGGNLPFNPLLLVMINGRQVYTDHFGFINWTALPVQLDEIQQIEIVRGPMGALFGVNAVSGVVNIVTKNPLYEQGGSVVVEAGNDEQLAVNAHHLFKFGEDVGIRLSAGYAEEEEFDDADILNEEDPERTNFALEALIKLSDKSTLTFEGTFAESNYTSFDHRRAAFGNFTRTISARAGYTLESGIGALEVKAFANFIDHDLDFTFDGNPELGANDRLFVVQAQDLIRVNAKNTARVSVEFRDFTFSTDTPNSGDVFYTLLSAGGMWEHAASDTLTLTGAVRVDNVDIGQGGPLQAFTGLESSDFDRNLTEFSFNASAVYKPTEIDTFRVAIGRSVGLPGLINLGLAFEAGPVNFVGNPGLASTPSIEGEVGYDRSLSSINGKLTTAFFYRNIQDFSLFPFEVNLLQPAVPLPSLSAQTVGDFDSYGFEFGLSGAAGENIVWDVNYSWTKVDEDIPRNINATDQSLVIPTNLSGNTPKHKINAHFGYQKGPWEVDLFGRFRSSIDFVQNAAAPGVFPLVPFDETFGLDARIGYRFSEGVEFYLAGDNITGSDRIGGSIFRTEERIRAGIRLSF